MVPPTSIWTGAVYLEDAATRGIPTTDLWLVDVEDAEVPMMFIPGGVGLDDVDIVVVGDVAGDAFGETILKSEYETKLSDKLLYQNVQSPHFHGIRCWIHDGRSVQRH